MPHTYQLRSGEFVTSRDGEWPTQYTNRTQAERAAAKIAGATMIQRGRPFYVRVPDATAFAWHQAADPHCTCNDCIAAFAQQADAAAGAEPSGQACPDCGAVQDCTRDCPNRARRCDPQFDAAPLETPAAVYLIVNAAGEYWSTPDGWTDRAGATAFSAAERGTLHLPIGGDWEPIGDRYVAAFYGAESAQRIEWIRTADYTNALSRELFPYWQQRAVEFAIAAAHAAGQTERPR